MYMGLPLYLCQAPFLQAQIVAYRSPSNKRPYSNGSHTKHLKKRVAQKPWIFYTPLLCTQTDLDPGALIVLSDLAELWCTTSSHTSAKKNVVTIFVNFSLDVADILTARNSAHRFLPFIAVSLAIDTPTV